jgi:hypothetical protein
MKGQEEGTCPWQPGLGFVYVKLGETREVQVSFMKPGHCFPGIEVLLALYNFLLCTAYKPDAKK